MVHIPLRMICKGVYTRMVKNSESRGHKTPSFTEEELFSRYFKDENAKKLYKDYIDSYNGFGYDPQLSLTIDRKDNTKGYTFENINGLMTFYENACLYQKTRQIPCVVYFYDKGILHYKGIFDSYMSTAEFISKDSGKNCDHSMVKACCIRRINYTCDYYTVRLFKEDKTYGKNLRAKIVPGTKPKQCKRVGQYCKVTMKLLREFESVTEAAEYIEGLPSEISRVCTGSRNVKTYRGFHWKYQ